LIRGKKETSIAKPAKSLESFLLLRTLQEPCAVVRLRFFPLVLSACFSTNSSSLDIV